MMFGDRDEVLHGLCFTIVLGFYFTVLQVFEYFECSFTIADGVYGSLFYVITGFHGVHVVIGNMMLIVCLWRLFNYEFSSERHLGLEVRVWYWHFVDVI